MSAKMDINKEIERLAVRLEDYKNDAEIFSETKSIHFAYGYLKGVIESAIKDLENMAKINK